jgi:plastocyanin
MLKTHKIRKYCINSQTINMILAAITVSIIVVAVSSQSLIPNNTVFAVTSQQQQQEQPNIKAASLFNTGTMVLPNNIKNLIITIPDEAHHIPNQIPAKRFINQTYLPQTAVVNPGTTVVWFSADVNHNHEINLNDQNNASIFKSGNYIFNTSTKPIRFNNTGTFSYSDPVNGLSTEAGVKGYVMTGTVKVVNQPSLASTTSNSSNIDTVGAYMVPARTVDQYVSEFKNHGFGIDSMQQFKALRNGSGNVLLVWTSAGMDLNKVLTALKQITPTLPYS